MSVPSKSNGATNGGDLSVEASSSAAGAGVAALKTPAAAVSTAAYEVPLAFFVLTRLTAASFAFAFLSVLMHAEGYFGCDGILGVPTRLGFVIGYWGTDLLVALLAVAALLNFTVVLVGGKTVSYKATRFVLAVSTALYAVVNYVGGEELFFR